MIYVLNKLVIVLKLNELLRLNTSIWKCNVNVMKVRVCVYVWNLRLAGGYDGTGTYLVLNG